MSKAIRTALVLVGICVAFLFGRTKETRHEFPVTIQPSAISLGELSMNETKKIDFEVRNYLAEEITIIGCESGCTCLHVSNLPMKLDANSSRTVSATLEPDAAGSFLVTLKLLVNKTGWVGPATVEYNIPFGPDTEEEPIALEPVPMPLEPAPMAPRT